MKKRTLFISLSATLLFIAFFIPPTGLLDRLRAGLQRYARLFPEKVYVHTDKPYYTSGEILWFKTYLVNAISHEPSTASRLVYVELINPAGEVLMKRNIHLENGGGAGDMGLDPELPTGTYQLRAYTNHMRNFGEDYLFKKPLTIWNNRIDAGALADAAGEPVESGYITPEAAAHPIQVGFYPEGGDLVYGLRSMIAIKAVGRDGRSVDISGKVVDGEGNEIVDFYTQELGLGAFPFSPEAGKQYQALVDFGGQQLAFPLPDPLEEGYVMKVSPRISGEVNVTVTASEGLSVREVVVIGQMRGILLGAIRAREGSGSSFTGSFPTDSIPSGILQLTLFTDAGEPLAERLVFVNNPDRDARLAIQTDQPVYNTREKVTVSLKLTDARQQPLPSDLSVAITDRRLVERKPGSEDLRTYLLFSSELKGYIENPGRYFEQENDRAGLYLLDLLMMTQGWRRFSWKQILSDEAPALAYPVEKGFTLRGRLTRLNSDEPVQGFVWVSTFDRDEMIAYKLLSSEDGVFGFTNVDIHDTTEVVVQARLPAKRLVRAGDLAENIPDNPSGNRNVSIETFPIPTPRVEPLEYLLRGRYDPEMVRDYVTEYQKIREVDSIYGGPSVLLETVVVTARAPSRDRFDRPGMLYGTPSDRIVADSLLKTITPISVFDFLRFTPGLLVGGSGLYQRVSIRGGSNVFYLLDGMPVDVTAIQSINPFDVDFIDVLKGPASAIYGGRAGDGVVAVYTRVGPGEQQELTRGPGIYNFTHPGYYKAREFYAPAYDRQQVGLEKPDYRTTLFWNPLVGTDETGMASFSFFTGDNSSEYDIVVQGVSSNGLPVTAHGILEVRSSR